MRTLGQNRKVCVFFFEIAISYGFRFEQEKTNNLVYKRKQEKGISNELRLANPL